MVPDFAIFSRELAANAGCVLVRMSPAQQMRSVLAKYKCRAAVQETDFNLMSNSPGEPAYLNYLSDGVLSEQMSFLTLLIRPDLSMIYAAYFTRVSWKNFRTRSGDFSSVCMCSVVAAFSLALVRTGTFV